MERNQGKSSDCQHLGGAAGAQYKDFEFCKAEARAAGANAINYKSNAHHGNCYYKRCADPDDLKLTNRHQGWDVYVDTCAVGEFSLSAT